MMIEMESCELLQAYVILPSSRFPDLKNKFTSFISEKITSNNCYIHNNIMQRTASFPFFIKIKP